MEKTQEKGGIMSIIVQKFGGSSVADAECIKRVANRVVETKRKGHQVVTVVSAMGDSTDHLIDLAKQVSKNPSVREMDMLLSTGEQVSISLLAMAIHALGEPVVSLTGPQAGIKTDGVFSKARIMDITSSRLEKELDEGKIVIVAGFQGITIDNDITTLGRGGSDTTAVALAAALKADICEIYTDVDGVYTTDPRLVKNAKKLSTITYDEMLELASLGAQVLQPRSVEFGKIHKVKIHVRSSFNHEEGTIVQEVSDMENDIVVSGVAFDKKSVRFTVYDVPDRPGVAKDIFKTLADRSINVDMIVQISREGSLNDITFTLDRDQMEEALKVMKEVIVNIGAKDVTCDDDVAKVSIVGAGMITNFGVAADMFDALAEEKINIELISTSEIKISVLVRKDQCEKAVRKLIEKFDLAEESIQSIE
ncbi:aspartate kinase [Youngiibacter fragilis 232.1]|uniref:Aspartokinase n=2 Tax=Youngiibacter TaxID=1408818 RepID=V7I751_9CLOT|nr:aspartate kinase [Youngiibacter fragilis 232.1]